MRKSTLAKIVGIFLTLGACATTQAQTYSNTVMGLNPAAYWPLNEAVQPPQPQQFLNITATNSGSLGANANGYYGAWYQASGNQWYLTNNIATEPGPIAGADTAMNCQQTGGQYIILPRNTNGVANAAITITAPFSIEAWVNMATTNKGLLTIVSEGGETTMNTGGPNPTNQFYGGYGVAWDGFSWGTYLNEFFFDCYLTNGESKANELDFAKTMAPSNWMHVVCTYDGTHEYAYTNGVEAGEKTLSANKAGLTYVVDPTSPLIIGAGPAESVSYGNALWGGLAEVAIYNQALSGTRVLAHYQAATSVASYTNAVFADSPTMFFRLNDGESQTSAGYPSSLFPVATNYGTLGSAADGVYQPGTTPGVPGPSYAGFGANSKGVAINGWFGAVDVGNSNLPSALNPTGATPLTVVSWFQGAPADNPGRFQEIVGHSDSSYRLSLGQNTPVGELHFNPGPGPELQAGSAAQVITNGFAVNDGNWHMVAGVTDGTNEFLYIDGSLALTNSNSAGIKITGTSDDLLLGGDPEYTYPTWGTANTVRNFDGNIAQVAFFTNALSANQIQSLYAAAEVPPSIWQEPVSTVTANQGQDVTVTTGIRGSAPVTYQWYRNGVAVAGQTNANLTYSPIFSSEAGTYYLVAENSSGSVTSSVVNVTVYGTVFIMQQTPSQLEIYSNSSPTLYVTASGQSPAYQWTVGGVAIPGATNSMYTVADIKASATYGCVLTNSLSTNQITPISITVLADPTNPYPAQILANGPIAYYRLDEAPGALTAYDYVGGFNADYTNVETGESPGYSYAPLSDPSETSALFGYGAVSDNNYAGNVPTYLNFAEPDGSNAEFSVEAWINNTGSGDNDGIVAMGYGGGGEQFVIDDGASSSGALRFFVRNAAGTVSAANSDIVVENDGLWHHVVGVCDEAHGFVYLYLDGVQVANATITAGSGLMGLTTPLSIGARESADNNPINYDAQYNGFINEVALYNRALTPAEVQADYYAIGFVPLNVQIQPSSWTTNSGANVTFTATVGGGTQPFSYQWSGLGGSIAGQTNATLVLSNVQTSASGTYSVTVANQYGSTNVTVQLTVTTGPAEIPAGGDIEPTSLVVYAESPVTLTVNPSGSLPFDCQWYQDGVAVAGATNTSYSFAALTGTNTYYCSVSNAYSYTEGSGPVVSSTATVVGETITTLNPSNFNSRLKIAFTGYTNSETLQCFPALVRLSPNLTGFSYGEFLAPNGADLRFADSSGTRELPYEVQQWNGADGVSTYWVQVPTLSGVTNSFIWAYWGNPNDTNPPAYTTNGEVWEPASFLGLPGYDVVYHLQETNFPYVDSTTNYPALDGVAPSVAPGIVGNGALFNGSSDYLDAGDVNLGNEFTESAWVNLSTSEYNIQALWCNGPGGYSTAEAVLFINDYYPQTGVTDPADGAVLFGDDDTQPETTTGLVNSNQWYLVTAAVNRTAKTIQFYVNGVPEPVAKGGSVTDDFPTNADMNLGRFLPNTANPNGSSYFNGIMDEARIHGGIDDSNWVWADYMTVASNSVFTTYSTVSNTIVLPIRLTIQLSGDHVILNWPEGTLQSASQVNGPYSNVSGATPPYTNNVSAAPLFYRVQAQIQ
ncbi:MAG TPA: DUF2341 domain-containing protein [Candidatus Sulfotelmatobacter sp.]|nr:DUF2341 domain-containing protein [Candidatus Sulfotelmatobacter sp.]